LAENYTVKQGDYLSKIASEHGFFDHLTIWNHPSNADLKKLRQNPSVLFPGDSLFIPDKQQTPYSRPTGNTHTFVIKRDRLKLRVVLEDQYEKPVAGAKCKITIEAEDTELTTDSKGKYELNIPLRAQTGAMVIESDDTPYDGELFSLHIGQLDPVETLSGQQARLDNLGYFPGSSDHDDDPAFLSALEEFQCDHDLAVDGKIGPKTRARLKQVHGC
jgi:Putative peptidoglycan binding domain/LysM domain